MIVFYFVSILFKYLKLFNIIAYINILVNVKKYMHLLSYSGVKYILIKILMTVN